MRKLLVSLLSIMMVVALAMPVFATGEGTGTYDDPVTTLEQLKTALAGDSTEIYVSGDISIDSLELTKGVSIYGKDKNAKLIGSIVLSAGNEESYTFDGLTFDGNGASSIISSKDVSSTQIGTVTISNCSFKNASKAIMFATDKDQSVKALNVSSSKFNNLNGNAVYVEDLESLSVTGSDFEDCGKGILPYTHSGNTIGSVSITENTFINTEVSVKLEIEDNATVSDNTSIKITDNTDTNGKGKIDYNVGDSLSGQIADKVDISNNGITLEGAPVVDVDGTTYKSLEEALGHVNDNSEITLLADTTIDKKLVINKDRITLDLGGFKLSASADFAEGTPLLEVQKAYEVNIKNGTLEASETTKHVVNIWQSGSVKLENLTLDHSKGANGAPLIVGGGQVSLAGELNLVTGPNSWYGMNLDTKYDTTMKQSKLDFEKVTKLTLTGDKDELLKIEDTTDKDNPIVMTTQGDLDKYAPHLEKVYGQVENVNGSFVKVEPSTDPDSEKPSRPTYRPSSPSKDLPSNTKECQKEFGDEYIWSDEYDACVIKFMIVDTATR